MPTWLIKLFQSVGRKHAAKRTGIAQIPTRISAEAKGAEYFNILVDAGLKPEDMAKHIKSEKDIIRLVNKVESIQKQNLKPTDTLKGIKSLEKKDPFQGWTPKIVPKETEAQIKARMIKENRSNVQKSYLRQVDKKIMDEMDLTKADLENIIYIHIFR